MHSAQGHPPHLGDQPPPTMTTADLRAAFEQSEAILRLEGMHPNPTSEAIKEAVIAGRVSGSQAVAELMEWAKQHQSEDGFIESRAWK